MTAPGTREAPAAAWALGPAREAEHDPARRTATGAWFTPQHLARHLTALADPPTPPRTVLDPACGGGAFLLAAAERWPGAALAGGDLDTASVRAARHAVRLAGRPPDGVVQADGLLDAMPPADLVLANPPFLSQLRTGTARDRARRHALSERYGDAAGRYVDDAALFLLAIARDLLAPDGTAVVIVPESLLATADAAAVRAEVARCCAVEVVWRDTERVFPGTPTCALRLRRRAHPCPADGEGWAALLVPDVPLVAEAPHGRRLGDLATATADFRDAHYLLADHVLEARAPAAGGDRAAGDPVVTVGLIDPAHIRWGQVPVRFAKRRWDRPAALDLPDAFRAARLGPKVLVATQTRVLEAAVDAAGRFIPSTPVITVRSDRPWHVGAALTSPIPTAVAARRHAGAARSRGALKLSARQLLALPLPSGDSTAWDAAAEAYRHAHDAGHAGRRAAVIACGRQMCTAYGIRAAEADVLLDWWVRRLPRR